MSEGSVLDKRGELAIPAPNQQTVDLDHEVQPQVVIRQLHDRERVRTWLMTQSIRSFMDAARFPSPYLIKPQRPADVVDIFGTFETAAEWGPTRLFQKAMDAEGSVLASKEDSQMLTGNPPAFPTSPAECRGCAMRRKRVLSQMPGSGVRSTPVTSATELSSGAGSSPSLSQIQQNSQADSIESAQQEMSMLFAAKSQNQFVTSGVDPSALLSALNEEHLLRIQHLNLDTLSLTQSSADSGSFSQRSQAHSAMLQGMLSNGVMHRRPHSTERVNAMDEVDNAIDIHPSRSRPTSQQTFSGVVPDETNHEVPVTEVSELKDSSSGDQPDVSALGLSNGYLAGLADDIIRKLDFDMSEPTESNDTRGAEVTVSHSLERVETEDHIIAAAHSTQESSAEEALQHHSLDAKTTITDGVQDAEQMIALRSPPKTPGPITDDSYKVSNSTSIPQSTTSTRILETDITIATAPDYTTEDFSSPVRQPVASQEVVPVGSKSDVQLQQEAFDISTIEADLVSIMPKVCPHGSSLDPFANLRVQSEKSKAATNQTEVRATTVSSQVESVHPETQLQLPEETSDLVNAIDRIAAPFLESLGRIGFLNRIFSESDTEASKRHALTSLRRRHLTRLTPTAAEVEFILRGYERVIEASDLNHAQSPFRSLPRSSIGLLSDFSPRVWLFLIVAIRHEAAIKSLQSAPMETREHAASAVATSAVNYGSVCLSSSECYVLSRLAALFAFASAQAGLMAINADAANKLLITVQGTEEFQFALHAETKLAAANQGTSDSSSVVAAEMTRCRAYLNMLFTERNPLMRLVTPQEISRLRTTLLSSRVLDPFSWVLAQLLRASGSLDATRREAQILIIAPDRFTANALQFALTKYDTQAQFWNVDEAASTNYVNEVKRRQIRDSKWILATHYSIAQLIRSGAIHASTDHAPEVQSSTDPTILGVIINFKHTDDTDPMWAMTLTKYVCVLAETKLGRRVSRFLDICPVTPTHPTNPAAAQTRHNHSLKSPQDNHQMPLATCAGLALREGLVSSVLQNVQLDAFESGSDVWSSLLARAKQDWRSYFEMHDQLRVPCSLRLYTAVSNIYEIAEYPFHLILRDSNVLLDVEDAILSLETVVTLKKLSELNETTVVKLLNDLRLASLRYQRCCLIILSNPSHAAAVRSREQALLSYLSSQFAEGFGMEVQVCLAYAAQDILGYMVHEAEMGLAVAFAKALVECQQLPTTQVPLPLPPCLEQWCNRSWMNEGPVGEQEEFLSHFPSLSVFAAELILSGANLTLAQLFAIPEKDLASELPWISPSVLECFSFVANAAHNDEPEQASSSPQQ